MIKIYSNIWNLLDSSEKKNAVWLLILMTVTSTIEILGVGSIMPFLSVLGNLDLIQSNKILNDLYMNLDFSSKQNFLVFLGCLSLFTLFVNSIFKSFTSYKKLKFSNNRRHSIAQKLLKIYINQPYKFFLSNNSSIITKMILSETDVAIQQGLIPSINLLSNILLSISILVFFLVINPYLALILSIVFGGFYFIVYKIVRKYLSAIGKKRIEANTFRFKIISETLGGIKDLKVLGREKSFFDSFTKPSKDFSNYISSSQILKEVPQYFIEVIAFGTLVTITIYFIFNNGENIDSLLPVLGLYAIGAIKLKPSVNQIFSSFSALKFGLPAIEKISYELKHNNLEDTFLKPETRRLSLKRELSLDGVNYSYNSNSNLVLKNINLTICSNSKVGIIGKTGSGKSTLVNLIIGLLDLTKGKILIDGISIEKSSVRSWQNNIGYVPQTIFLSDDSIASNIAFGVEKNSIDMDQVKKVSKMAMAHNFITMLEKGYDTIIGERGIKLSGGQRQRIGIARSLYHNPDILILDEATSSLDNKTEKEVMRAIDNMTGTRTIIIVAHRLSTIKNCDKIIELENGTII